MSMDKPGASPETGAGGTVTLESVRNRIDWSVLDWNTSAIRFYNALGAHHVDGWNLNRLEREAIEKVAAYQNAKGTQLRVTVEVRNLVELYEVMEVGQVDRILFDNFELLLMREAVATVNKQFETEASGGINIHNVREVAQTGVDFISVGALTHSAQSLDLSLKVVQ